jgi:hypothetical protein
MSGDTITHIDDAPIYGLHLDQVEDKLRGPIDTPVRLRISRKNQDNPVDVSIARRSIQPSGAQLEARIEDGRLVINAPGPWPILDFDIRKPMAVEPFQIQNFMYMAATIPASSLSPICRAR